MVHTENGFNFETLRGTNEENILEMKKEKKWRTKSGENGSARGRESELIRLEAWLVASSQCVGMNLHRMNKATTDVSIFKVFNVLFIWGIRHYYTKKIVKILFIKCQFEIIWLRGSIILINQFLNNNSRIVKLVEVSGKDLFILETIQKCATLSELVVLWDDSFKQL